MTALVMRPRAAATACGLSRAAEYCTPPTAIIMTITMPTIPDSTFTKARMYSTMAQSFVKSLSLQSPRKRAASLVPPVLASYGQVTPGAFGPAAVDPGQPGGMAAQEPGAGGPCKVDPGQPAGIGAAETGAGIISCRNSHAIVAPTARYFIKSLCFLSVIYFYYSIARHLIQVSAL